MTLLLIDLDDTLLGNAMDSFVPAYLQGLAGRMASVAEPQKLIKALLDGTAAMVADANPGLTLEEKFDAVFFPALGLHRPAVQSLIDTFYRDDFPRLASLTQRFPAAPHLVSQALSRGDQVVIATNPLFPRTAILQRLSWAGLPAEQVPFALIPSYETFHLAKPNPAYMAELLAQLGWPEGPVLMVGDDPRLDIEAARQLGLPVFWIAAPDSVWPGPGLEPPRGALEDLLPWMDRQPASALLPDFTLPSAMQAVLRSTPAALATLLAGRSFAELTFQPQSGEWSSVEVVCHLRDVEREVNLMRLGKALESDNPFIPGQDTDQWALQRQYIQQDCLEAQQTFLQARLNLLTIVESMTDADWDRPVRHAIFGPTKLRELINIIAGHDRLHVRQVLQALRASRN
ncbi:MAG TPA: DinB family protein [Anaerolineales bacterium]|nr:DinB family protein [Anaerolineales bacterium]